MAEVAGGAPQDPTTGRYEVLRNLGKAREERRFTRWHDVPAWYRVLDRFGLPTLFALLLLYGGYKVAGRVVDIADRQATQFAATFQKQVDATEKLSERVRELGQDTRETMQLLLERSRECPPPPANRRQGGR